MLDLSTERPERQKISIDGVEYEMKTQADLSLGDSQYLYAVSQKIQGTDDPDKLDEKGREKINQMIYTAALMVLMEVPQEVYDKLNDFQRIKIIETFATAEFAAGDATSQESAEQSQDSSDSTEATQNDG